MFLGQGKGAKGTLKHVVLLDEASDADRAACAAAGLSLHTLKDLAKARLPPAPLSELLIRHADYPMRYWLTQPGQHMA